MPMADLISMTDDNQLNPEASSSVVGSGDAERSALEDDAGTTCRTSHPGQHAQQRPHAHSPTTRMHVLLPDLTPPAEEGEGRCNPECRSPKAGAHLPVGMGAWIGGQVDRGPLALAMDQGSQDWPEAERLLPAVDMECQTGMPRRSCSSPGTLGKRKQAGECWSQDDPRSSPLQLHLASQHCSAEGLAPVPDGCPWRGSSGGGAGQPQTARSPAISTCLLPTQPILSTFSLEGINHHISQPCNAPAGQEPGACSPSAAKQHPSAAAAAGARQRLQTASSPELLPASSPERLPTQSSQGDGTLNGSSGSPGDSQRTAGRSPAPTRTPGAAPLCPLQEAFADTASRSAAGTDVMPPATSRLNLIAASHQPRPLSQQQLQALLAQADQEEGTTPTASQDTSNVSLVRRTSALTIFGSTGGQALARAARGLTSGGPSFVGVASALGAGMGTHELDGITTVLAGNAPAHAGAVVGSNTASPMACSNGTGLFKGCNGVHTAAECDEAATWAAGGVPALDAPVAAIGILRAALREPPAGGSEFGPRVKKPRGSPADLGCHLPAHNSFIECRAVKPSPSLAPSDRPAWGKENHMHLPHRDQCQLANVDMCLTAGHTVNCGSGDVLTVQLAAQLADAGVNPAVMEALARQVEARLRAELESQFQQRLQEAMSEIRQEMEAGVTRKTRARRAGTTEGGTLKPKSKVKSKGAEKAVTAAQLQELQERLTRAEAQLRLRDALPALADTPPSPVQQHPTQLLQPTQLLLPPTQLLLQPTQPLLLQPAPQLAEEASPQQEQRPTLRPTQPQQPTAQLQPVHQQPTQQQPVQQPTQQQQPTPQQPMQQPQHGLQEQNPFPHSDPAAPDSDGTGCDPRLSQQTLPLALEGATALVDMQVDAQQVLPAQPDLGLPAEPEAQPAQPAQATWVVEADHYARSGQGHPPVHAPSQAQEPQLGQDGQPACTSDMEHMPQEADAQQPACVADDNPIAHAPELELHQGGRPVLVAGMEGEVGLAGDTYMCTQDQVDALVAAALSSSGAARGPATTTTTTTPHSLANQRMNACHAAANEWTTGAARPAVWVSGDDTLMQEDKPSGAEAAEGEEEEGPELTEQELQDAALQLLGHRALHARSAATPCNSGSTGGAPPTSAPHSVLAAPLLLEAGSPVSGLLDRSAGSWAPSHRHHGPSPHPVTASRLGSPTRGRPSLQDLFAEAQLPLLACDGQQGGSHPGSVSAPQGGHHRTAAGSNAQCVVRGLSFSPTKQSTGAHTNYSPAPSADPIAAAADPSSFAFGSNGSVCGAHEHGTGVYWRGAAELQGNGNPPPAQHQHTLPGTSLQGQLPWPMLPGAGRPHGHPAAQHQWTSAPIPAPAAGPPAAPHTITPVPIHNPVITCVVQDGRGATTPSSSASWLSTPSTSYPNSSNGSRLAYDRSAQANGMAGTPHTPGQPMAQAGVHTNGISSRGPSLQGRSGPGSEPPPARGTAAASSPRSAPARMGLSKAGVMGAIEASGQGGVTAVSLAAHFGITKGFPHSPEARQLQQHLQSLVEDMDVYRKPTLQGSTPTSMATGHVDVNDAAVCFAAM